MLIVQYICKEQNNFHYQTITTSIIKSDTVLEEVIEYKKHECGCGGVGVRAVRGYGNQQIQKYEDSGVGGYGILKIYLYYIKYIYTKARCLLPLCHISIHQF